MQRMREVVRMNKWILAVWCLGAALLGCGGMSTGLGGGDTNTNFLQSCTKDAHCGSATACMCGICTVSCYTDGDCERGSVSGVCSSNHSCGSEATCQLRSIVANLGESNPGSEIAAADSAELADESAGMNSSSESSELGGGDPAQRCGTELHIISTYTGAPAMGTPRLTGEGQEFREVNVHIERAGSHILALSAAEPTYWTVSAGEGAKIEEVVLNGYFKQEVNHDDASWTVTYFDDFSGRMRAYPEHVWSRAWRLGRTDSLVSALEPPYYATKFGGEPSLRMRSFTGCRELARYTLEEDMTVDVDCADGDEYQRLSNGVCEGGQDWIPMELPPPKLGADPTPTGPEAWCWTVRLDESALVVVQLDPVNGNETQVGSYLPADEPFAQLREITGMGLVDGHLTISGKDANDSVWLENGGQWLDLDLKSGLVLAGGESSGQVLTSTGTEYVTWASWAGLIRYKTFRDLVWEQNGIPMGVTYGDTLISHHGGRIWGVGTGLDSRFLRGYDLETGLEMTDPLPMPIDVFDIGGLAGAENRLFVLTREEPQRLMGLDPNHGEVLSEVTLQQRPDGKSYGGLWCGGAASPLD